MTLTQLFTAIANAIRAKKGLTDTISAVDFPAEILEITPLKGETKTVTPTTSQQTITPSSGKNAITQVTVNAVTSAIDNNIVAENIKKDVTILNVTGTFEGGASDYNTKMEFGATTYPLAQSIREINGLNIDNKNLNNLFSNCTNLTKIENFSFTNCSGLKETFSNCNQLSQIDLSKITLGYYCSLQSTFNNCSNIGNIDVHHWGASGWGGTTFSNTFSGCSSTEEIDISGLGPCASVATIQNLFRNCTNLRTINFPPTIRLSGIQNSSSYISGAFSGCPNLDNDTLNAILGFLPTITKLTTASYKTLKNLGFSSDQATVMQTLSNWTAASNAGWTTGY